MYELAKHPETWTTIYALSRSQTESYPDNVIHGQVDLAGDPQDIAKQLQGIEVEYVFFCAYLQKKDEAEQAKVNGGSSCDVPVIRAASHVTQVLSSKTSLMC